MPRKPRFFLPNIPVHMIIHGNNRQAVFSEEDYVAYRNWMKEGRFTIAKFMIMF